MKSLPRRIKLRESRRAAILVLAAFMIILAFCFAALAIDLGMLALATNQLQNAADAAALAGAAQLVPSAQPPFPLKSPLAVAVNVPSILGVTLGLNLSTSVSVAGTDIQVIQPQVPPNNSAAAIAAARAVAAQNGCLQISSLQTVDGDVQTYYQSQSSVPVPLIPIPGVDSLLNALILNSNVNTNPNAVSVTVRSNAAGNCLLPLSFAPLMGMSSIQKSKSASAMIAQGYSAVAGARVMPIAMDVTIWRALRLGNGTVNGIPLVSQLLGQNGAPVILIDEQAWNPSTEAVTSGSDGIWEVLMITDPLGNLSIPGLPLNLSALTNTASTLVTLQMTPNQTEVQLEQQVQYGLNSSSMPKSMLTLPCNIQGTKGVPDGVVSQLKKTIGQPQVIPLFATLSGTVGNTLNQLLGLPQTYQIVGWGGCVITEVQDLGVLTIIKLQPAPYSSSNIRRTQSGNPAYSDLVFTGPRLIQ